MALYRPLNNYPAIDPLAPCTAVARVAPPGRFPLPLGRSRSPQESEGSPGNHAETPRAPATPLPPPGSRQPSHSVATHASVAGRPLSPVAGRGSPLPLGRTGSPQEREGTGEARVFRKGASQLQSPQIVLIFDTGLANRPDYLEWHLYHCLTWLVSGPFAQGLRQYGAGPGAYAGFYELTMPQGQVGAAQLADWLDSSIQAGVVPPPSQGRTGSPQERGGQGVGQPLYMLFPGPGTALGDPGFAYGVDFCAYHSASPVGAIYGVMPFPTAQGCSLWGQLSPLDALCMTASHELAEAMTDAIPGQGETGPEGEIDDFAPCLWNPVPITVDGDQYKIQAYWSDADQRCWRPPPAPGNPLPVGAQFIAPSRMPIAATAVGAPASGATPSRIPIGARAAPAPTPDARTPTPSEVIDLIQETGDLAATLDPAHRELVERFTSRKFLLTVAGIGALLAGPALHYIPPADAAIGVTLLTAVYTIAEAVVDAQRSS